MQDLLISVVSSTVLSGLLAGALIFLARTWITQRLQKAIQHEYDQKLEAYKAQLKAQNQIELERLRCNLSMMSSEHQVRFLKFHDRLAEVVAETYALIQRYRTAVHQYSKRIIASCDPPLAERHEKVDEAKKEFWNYFLPNEIYFPEQTSDDIRALERMLFTIAHEFCLAHEPKPDCQLTPEERSKGWKNAGEPLLSQEGPLFTRIHGQFQDLIGVRPKTEMPTVL